jgi:hypothetical protein
MGVEPSLRRGSGEGFGGGFGGVGGWAVLKRESVGGSRRDFKCEGRCEGKAVASGVGYCEIVSTRRVERVGAWDRVPVQSRDLREVFADSVEVRRRRRIGEVERARDGLLDDAEVVALAQDLILRQEFWRTRSWRWRLSPKLGALGILRIAFAGLVLMSGAALMGVFLIVAVAVLGTLSLVMMILHLFSEALPWTCSKRLKDGCCANCGYALRGLADAVVPSRIHGVAIGPERCPECGMAWPLVPPPMPR